MRLVSSFYLRATFKVRVIKYALRKDEREYDRTQKMRGAKKRKKIERRRNRDWAGKREREREIFNSRFETKELKKSLLRCAMSSEKRKSTSFLCGALNSRNDRLRPEERHAVRERGRRRREKERNFVALPPSIIVCRGWKKREKGERDGMRM